MRPLARGPRVLIGRPLPLGFGLESGRAHATTGTQSGNLFGFIPRGVEWEMSISFDMGGLISRVSAKKNVGCFFRLFGVFCAFGGGIFVLFGGIFVLFARQRENKNRCFFFGGGMSKTGNSRSASGTARAGLCLIHHHHHPHVHPPW